MSTPSPMPTIFFGHGNPMNALQCNAYTEGWAAIGAKIPRPKEALDRDAMLAASSHDHYLPLLYVIAPRREGEGVTFLVEGIDGGSVSMLTVQIG